MSEETADKGGDLTSHRKKCFVGHSLDATWSDDLMTACNKVLPEFDLEPWFAVDHFDSARSVRDKVVKSIADTQYGIYDLSYWRKDEKSEWMLPRNVLIEIGIAIGLNRPTLLLQHAENRISGVLLPNCLKGLNNNILEFSGGPTLRKILREHLRQWIHIAPEQDLWNSFCTFGNQVCKYREIHSHMQRSQNAMHCHISDGSDANQPDFRESVEEVLGRYDGITFDYLDKLCIEQGYSFLLCSYCQSVRSAQFAIYRITPHTPAETYLAIGMSLALEWQFNHKIPKILLAANAHDVPSLLSGYEVVEVKKNKDHALISSLQKYMPQVIRQVKQAQWKQKPLSFIKVMPKPATKFVQKPEKEPLAERIDTIDQASSNQLMTYQYSRKISSQYPGLFIILLDQSDSMLEEITGYQMQQRVTKADVVAMQVNNIIESMIKSVGMDQNTGRVKNSIFCTVLGYGDNVYPLLSLSNTPVSIRDLDEHPRGTVPIKEIRRNASGTIIERTQTRRFWFEPQYRGNTEMALAFEQAKAVIDEWLSSSPEMGQMARDDCPPPVIINITDAKHNGNGRYVEASEEIRKLKTRFGSVLIFNIHVTHENVLPCFLPMSLDEIAKIKVSNYSNSKMLFEMSSVLPDTVRRNAEIIMHHPIPEGARCFLYNANPNTIMAALQVATLGMMDFT